MKKIITSLALLALFATNAFAQEAGTKLFNDVDGTTTYQKGIEFLVANGIVKGYEDGSYQPKKGLDRAEMIKIVVEGSLVYNEMDKNVLNAYVGASCFTDVPKNEWYAKYVCYAKEKGWVKGYAGDTYKPGQQVNNVEALKMVAKGFGLDYTETQEPWYKDVVEDFSEDNLIPFTYFGFDHGMDRGTMADLITRVIQQKEGTLDSYLGDRADIVVTYETIEKGLKLYGLEKDEVNPGDGDSDDDIEVLISAQNNSGQSGKATLQASSSKTKVTLELSGNPDQTQPAHIHLGSCADLGAVEYPLSSVEDGKSTTTLDISLSDLMEKAKESPGLAINVHKSADESDVYYACGNVVTLENTEDPDAEEAADPKTYTVDITEDGFSPEELSVKKGDTVKWVNKDADEKHWPASNDHPTHTDYPGTANSKCDTDDEDGIFDACSGLEENASWSFTFDEVGSWDYHDHLSPSLTGTITVE
ncbi:S-layer homology domain-containing protein [Candidatus Peregrinibacteria bacterium]|nr:S-layer homology domain-containing protein [Candidatus Peregrinibacteria bacterium]